MEVILSSRMMIIILFVVFFGIQIHFTMDEFRKNLTAKEIEEIFRNALHEAKRPAQELILNDTDLCKMLKISKRTSATWRANGMIAYHKVGGIVFYLYSDVLDAIKSNRIEPFQKTLNIKL